MDINQVVENKEINSDDWSKLSLTDLYKQKQILYDRLEFVYNLNNEILFNSLQQGLSSIEYHISSKINDPNTKKPNNIT